MIRSIGYPLCARAAIGFYNDEVDIERFVAALGEIAGQDPEDLPSV